MVGFPAGLSSTSFHLSPTFHLSPKLGACGRIHGWAGLSPTSFHLLPICFSFVSHVLSFPKQFTVRGSQCFKEWSPWCWMVWSFVSQFFSFVSQAGVPADRAENSSAGTKPERQKETNHMGDKRIEMLHVQRKRATTPVTDTKNT